MNYEQVEKKYSLGNHRCRCIDGKITGCGNCVGFCSFDDHRGFLTKALRKEHNCLGKGCFYYVPKSREKENNDNPFEDAYESVKIKMKNAYEIACAMTREFEDFKIKDFGLSDDFVCELSYITVFDGYELEPIIQRINSETGLTVKMKKLNYSFENAAALIFEIKCA